ncbi:MAG: leucine-rich repeat protein [Clostridia bacterium]|nr:leucine-rich repeat protein [Clostridia bacterium]
MELEFKAGKVKRSIKKTLSLFLTILMLIGTVNCSLGIVADALGELLDDYALNKVTSGNATDGNATDGNVTDGSIIYNGKFGDTVFWSIDDKGKLLISGEGMLVDCYDEVAPWFDYCTYIKTVVIEDGITGIGDDVFYKCINLENIIIADSVTNIGNSAFHSCENLKRIIIPKNVSFIGFLPFMRCNNLSEIVVENGNSWYSSKDGVLFEMYGALHSYPLGKTDKTYTIPNGIKRIYYGAFMDSKTIENIVMSNSVTEIGGSAFQGCKNLKTVTFSSSVTKIEQQAFNSCENLTDVYFNGTQNQWNKIKIYSHNDDLLNANIHFNSGDNVTDGNVTDGNISCKHLNRTSVPAKESNCYQSGYTAGVLCEDCNEWLSGHREIKRKPHIDKNADKLCDVCQESAPVTSGNIGENIKWGLYADGELVVEGNGKMDDYGSVVGDKYKDDVKKVVIKDGITSIQYSAFKGYINLETVSLPDTLKEIADCSFMGCTSLDYIDIPESVTEIGGLALCKAISFTPKTPYVLEEIVSEGYYTYDDSGLRYYDYYTPSFEKGDSFTIYNIDGTTDVYTFDGVEKFISEKWDSFSIYFVDRYDEQGKNHWIPDGEHNYFTVSLGDVVSCKVNVEIRENPVESIGFVPVENYVFYEGYSGGHYTYDDQDSQYYYFYSPSFEIGDKLIVNYNDGRTAEYTYGEYDEYDDDYGYSYFMSEDGKIIKDEDVDINLKQPYSINGKNNSLEICYAEKQCSINVDVKENPVDSIEFVPLEPYEFVENISTNYYGEYYIGFELGDTLTVNYKDDTSKNFIYTRPDYSFIASDGEELYGVKIKDSQSSNNPWSVGTYFATVEFAQKTYDVPVVIKECTISSISAKHKYSLYNGYDCELNANASRFIYEDNIICTVVMTDGNTALYTLKEMADTYNVDVDYYVRLENIGDNTGYIEVGNLRGDFVVNVKEKPDDVNMQPYCALNGYHWYVEKGKDIDYQILDFADKGYKHSINVSYLPDGLELNNDGRLTGKVNTVTGRFSPLEIKFEVRWENSYANEVYEIYIYCIDEKDKVEIPENVDVLNANVPHYINASEENPKWFKVKAFRHYGWITDSCCEIFTSNGLPAYCDGYGDGGYGVAGSYHFTLGEYFYIKVTGPTLLYIWFDTWLPSWDADSASSNNPSGSVTLVDNNVEKSFDDDTNRFWNVYLLEASFSANVFEKYAYYVFGTMTRLASPVNIHLELIDVESSCEIINIEKYKYDPNNKDECEEIGASTTQNTLKDELLDGEKEYRFDRVYYFMHDVVDFALSEEKLLYVPVGYFYDDQHIVKCTEHNDRIECPQQDATCTEVGYTAGVFCPICNEWLSGHEEIPALGHKESAAVKENEVVATCIAIGSYDVVVYCSVCGEELSRETEIVSATGHSYETSVTAPTCEENGYTTYTCACGDTYTSDEVSAIGHDYEGVLTTEPTCTEKGVKTFTCKNDASHTYTEEVNALGHTEESHEAKAPTCTEIGWDEYVTCSRCDYTTYAEKAALGHKESEAVKENDVAATCTDGGSYDMAVYCSICSEELGRETIVVDALNHKDTLIQVDAQDPNCSNIGWETYEYCTECNYTTYNEIAALGHIDEDNDGVCDIGGENILCSDCGMPVHEGDMAEYICTIVNFVKLLISFIQFIQQLKI